MITSKEIKSILAQRDFKQKNKKFGFDAALKGLGVGCQTKKTKKHTKSF